MLAFTRVSLNSTICSSYEVNDLIFVLGSKISPHWNLLLFAGWDSRPLLIFQSLVWLSYFPNHCSVGLILILGILAYGLSRSLTGFRKTDTVVNRLIRGAIQTGLFASIFALADLFSFLLHQDTFLYAMFAYPIGRIYTNVSIFSVLAVMHVNLTIIRLFWTRWILAFSWGSWQLGQ